MMASHDASWLRTRRAILDGLKKQVIGRLGKEPGEIVRARRSLESELKARWRTSTKQKLLTSLAKSDVVFCGDFHAFPQSQRTHLKLLKERVPAKNKKELRPLCLALEAFAVESQIWIDKYLSGKINEAELVEKTNWNEEWGFPWENYRGLVEFAKQNGHRVLALGTSRKLASLKERETAAAATLAKFMSEESDRDFQIYVIFGELHLASRYLPMQVKAEFKKQKLSGHRFVTIHLNSEDPYFKLAKKGLENKIDVVEYSKNRFCVLASPPWVQWQSYLLFLDNALEAAELDDDEGWVSDFSALIVSLVRLASQDLDLKMKADDIAVYGADNDQFWPQLKRRLTTNDLKVASFLIASGRSFFVPRGVLFYLSRTTVNHAAELAGQYIHAKLSGREENTWRMPRDFEALIWIEAIGFFISKLINHKRHSETLPDLQAKLAGMKSQDQSREALMLALDQRYRELFFYHHGKRRRSQFRTRSAVSRFEAARILGGMMGERLYLALRSRTIKLETVLEWMRKNPTDEDFATFYESVVLRLGPGTGALRTRKERL